MEEVSAPVVAIACILAAVFIPVAFLGGISGQIYKQFALTIAASVLISAFNALSLSPALSAMLLRPKMKHRGRAGPLLRRLRPGLRLDSRKKYLIGVGALIRKSAFALVGSVLLLAGGRRAVRSPPRRLPAGRGSGHGLRHHPASGRRFA